MCRQCVGRVCSVANVVVEAGGRRRSANQVKQDICRRRNAGRMGIRRTRPGGGNARRGRRKQSCFEEKAVWFHPSKRYSGFRQSTGQARITTLKNTQSRNAKASLQIPGSESAETAASGKQLRPREFWTGVAGTSNCCLAWSALLFLGLKNNGARVALLVWCPCARGE